MNFKNVMSRLGRAAKGYSGISGATIALFIAIIVVFNVAFYALAERYSWYAYTKASYEHEIGDVSRSYLGDLDTEGKTVRIIFCKTKDRVEADSVASLAHETAKQLAARHDFIEIEYVNIITEPGKVRKYLYETDPATGVEKETGYVISSDSIIFDSGDEYMVQGLSNFFFLDSNSTILAYNGEEVMLSMIHWVLTDDHKTVYFTVNHGESSGIALYNILVCAGYRVAELNLTLSDIPDDAAMIVVADPKYDFEKAQQGSGINAELDKLESYLADGGKLFVSIDPLSGELPHLDAFLAEWGMQREYSTVRDVSDAVSSDGLALMTHFASGSVASEMASLVGRYNDSRVVLREASPIKMVAPTNGANAESLLVSAPGAAAYYQGEQVSSSGNYTLAALSENASGGSLFLVSSIYLAAQDLLWTDGYANGEFLYALMGETLETDVPLGCTILAFDNERIEGMTMGVMHVWTIILIAVVPIAVLIVGNVIRVRRKNR